jgi:hypothetical protein
MIINFILVLMIYLGQNQSNLPSDFSTLQKMSVEELALKTQAHKEVWGLGKIDRWDLSQDTGELERVINFKSVFPERSLTSESRRPGNVDQPGFQVIARNLSLTGGIEIANQNFVLPPIGEARGRSLSLLPGA